ncbi:MAG: hypothetical protein KC505_03375 [Myxococcales bacterium]|nr:hypothetical protein [Myxococcales bacterium]USN50692.1 MAG: hypothetical protein H6731_10615 [Myxococcales bacterium]
MKSLLIIFTLLTTLNINANSLSNRCASLETELQEALSQPNLKAEFLDQESIKKCFNAKLVLSNNYDGYSKDNYELFMNELNGVLIDIDQSLTIMDQVNENLAQSNHTLEESQALVNTINLWQFTKFGKKFYLVASGFGDDDFFVNTLFKGDETKILLMRAE